MNILKTTNYNPNFCSLKITPKKKLVKQFGEDFADKVEEIVPDLEFMAKNIDISVNFVKSEPGLYGFDYLIKKPSKNRIKAFFDENYVSEKLRNYSISKNDVRDILLQKIEYAREKFISLFLI